MIAMKKNSFQPRSEWHKNFMYLLGTLQYKHGLWGVWQDFVVLSAISIANLVGSPFREEREKRYREAAAKYKPEELNIFSEMLALVVEEMERDPDQDILGELFMALGISDNWKGQFFTPYTVCRAMAAMTFDPNMQQQVQQQGWVSVNDPACGAGALLIAFANECRRQKINYQTDVLFVAQDIDYLAGCMCYIQMSLMGCPGYVVIDDSLIHPIQSYDDRGLLPKVSANVWFTPMYFRDIWHWRRLFAQLELKTQYEEENAYGKCSGYSEVP